MAETARVSTTPALVPIHSKSLHARRAVIRRQAALCCRIMASEPVEHPRRQHFTLIGTGLRTPPMPPVSIPVCGTWDVGKGPHNPLGWYKAAQGAVRSGCLVMGLCRYPEAALFLHGIMHMPRGALFPCGIMQPPRGCPIPVWDYEAIHGIPYYPVGLC